MDERILEIKDFIESFGLETYINDLDDIVIPEKNVVLELCIFSKYCENISGNHRSYHFKKLNSYLNDGLTLYVIFEDEYENKKVIVCNRLKHLLGLNSGEVVYARKCVVREVDNKICSKFINDFHIQGNHGSRIKLGLFANNGFAYSNLVSVMTFGVLSRAKGNKKTKKGSFELIRFCSDSSYRVIGGAGKLFKYFERNYEWESILSFADRRYSGEGNLYKQLGFEVSSVTQPNYYYLKLPEFTERKHRFAFRRDVLRDRAIKETTMSEEDILSKTEFDLAKILGYDRIWDCGNYKFVKYNHNV